MKTRPMILQASAALALFLATLGCETAPKPEASPEASAAPAVATPDATPMAAAPAPTAAPAAAPERIRLQHVLISFAGKVPGKAITRSQEEARVLAQQILDRARKGEDFDTLVQSYTDDRAPGIYALSNSGIEPAQGEFSRDRMVPAFGNVGFSLAPGEIGMADYDPATSPYGWHIIKRLE